MSENVEFSEESLRRIAAQKVTFRFSVIIHAICYIAVNNLLILINVLASPSSWWVIYPILGWLIGLMIHATAYWLYARGTKYGIRGIVFNIVAYIFTSLLLIVSDYITEGVINWAYWPAVCWGFGVIGHVIITLLVTKEKSPKSEGKLSRRERAIEEELQKMHKHMKKQEGAG